MSALDDLLKKSTKNYTPLEAAVVFMSERHPGDSNNAAEELAAKDEALAAAYREMLNLGNILNWPSEIPMSYAEAMNEVKAALTKVTP